MLQVIDALGEVTQPRPPMGHPEKRSTTTKSWPKTSSTDRYERLERIRVRCKTCCGKGCVGRCRF